MSSSAPTRAKTTELPSQLASLGLNNIADNLDDFLARATQKTALSPSGPRTARPSRSRPQGATKSRATFQTLQNRPIQTHR